MQRPPESSGEGPTTEAPAGGWRRLRGRLTGLGAQLAAALRPSSLQQNRKPLLAGAAAVLVVLAGHEVSRALARRALLERLEARHVRADGRCSVGWAWRGVRLSDCTLTQQGAGVADVERITVRFDGRLRPASVEGTLRRVELSLTSREDADDSARREGSPRGLGIDVHVVRFEATLADLWLEADDVLLERGDGELRAEAKQGRARYGPLSARLQGARLRRADRTEVTVDALVLQAAARPAASAGVFPAAPAPAAAGAPPEEDEADALASPHGTAATPAPEPTAATPWTSALDRLGTTMARARRVLLPLLPGALLARVDALSLVAALDHDELTLGPGVLRASREARSLVVSYGTERGTQGPPLEGELRLPLDDDGELRADLRGGPVPLTLSTADDGASPPTLQGVLHMRVAQAPVTLEAEGDMTVRRLTVGHPALAAEPLRQLEAALRFDVRAGAEGVLEIRHAEAGLGALRLAVRGRVEGTARGLQARLAGELPVAPCDALLASMPSGLFPSLQGARLHGSFAGLGSLVVDTAAPDDLELRFDVADGCRFITVPAALDADRFRQPFRHRAHHPDGSTFERETGPGTPTWTPFTALSPYLVVAVITTEDGGFYQHHGVSHRAVRDALAANLRAGRFVRGASTITMQLAKNLFLGREKTLSRKLEELALTAYLEQAFSKNELLELYFNVIEFGPDVYGIAEAAEHYFGRTPNELNLVESMFLSTLLPSPLRLHAMRDRGAVTPRWRKQVDALLRIAHKRGLVTAGELSEALAAPLDLHTDDAPPPKPRPPAAPHRRVPDTFDDWEELPSEGP